MNDCAAPPDMPIFRQRKGSAMIYRNAWFAIPLLGAMVVAGCGSPSKPNIELRKKNQTDEIELAALRQQVIAQRQMIEGLEKSRANAKQLPPEELKKLFVAFGIKFARL